MSDGEESFKTEPPKDALVGVELEAGKGGDSALHIWDSPRWPMPPFPHVEMREWATFRLCPFVIPT